MELSEFNKLVNESVEALPERIKKKLNNVEIIVEEGDSPNNSLFGLYQGISQLRRGSSYGLGPTLPDKITIWKGTIEKYAFWESKGDLKTADLKTMSMVRRVVWHEIGHHFGFDEKGIRKLEEKWLKDNKI